MWPHRRRHPTEPPRPSRSRENGHAGAALPVGPQAHQRFPPAAPDRAPRRLGLMVVLASWQGVSRRVTLLGGQDRSERRRQAALPAKRPIPYPDYGPIWWWAVV